MIETRIINPTGALLTHARLVSAGDHDLLYLSFGPKHYVLGPVTTGELRALLNHQTPVIHDGPVNGDGSPTGEDRVVSITVERRRRGRS